MREDTIVLADGRRLGYAEHGVADGIPVLYFHGMPGGRQARLHETALEASGIRLLSVERPGVGLSDRLPDRTLLDWPKDVAEFADVVGLERFGVVGLSAGGPFTFAVAYALGARVTAAAVVSSVGPVFDYPQFDAEVRPEVAALLPIARSDIDQAIALVRQFLGAEPAAYAADPEAFAEQFFTIADGDRSALRADRDTWEKMLEATYSDPDAAADDAIANHGPWGFDPADITVPMRGWWGTADTMQTIGPMKLGVERAGGEVVVIEGGAHIPSPVVQTEVAAWLASFG